MREMKRRRLQIWIVVFVLAIYCVSYVVCRRSHIIVHVTMNAGDKYTFHDVVAGEAKLASPNPIVAAFFAPLCYLESRCWRIAKPIGSPYP